MTRTEIRAQARLLSNEASTARFSDAQVNSLIDDAQTIVATQIGWKAVSANISVNSPVPQPISRALLFGPRLAHQIIKLALRLARTLPAGVPQPHTTSGEV